MKKMVAVLGVVAAVAAFVGVSHAFDIPGVTKSAPSSVSDVAKEPANFEYDQCKANYADKYSDNAGVNSKTLPNILNKDLGSPIKTMTDERGDKKGSGRWEAEYKYGKVGAVTLKANCDFKKCYSVYCNKK